MEGWSKYLLGKTEKYELTRTSICSICKDNNKGVCGICGCNLKAKIKCKGCKCPKNLW